MVEDYNIKSWNKFKKARTKEALSAIAGLDTRRKYYDKQIATIEKEKEQKRALIEKIPKICDAVIEAYEAMKAQKKFIPNQKISQAILDRGAASVVGMTSGFTSVIYTSTTIRYESQYWCDEWLEVMLTNIDSSRSVDRQAFYKLLETLALEPDEDKIKEQLAMFTLTTLK